MAYPLTPSLAWGASNLSYVQAAPDTPTRKKMPGSYQVRRYRLGRAHMELWGLAARTGMGAGRNCWPPWISFLKAWLLVLDIQLQRSPWGVFYVRKHVREFGQALHSARTDAPRGLVPCPVLRYAATCIVVAA